MIVQGVNTDWRLSVLKSEGLEDYTLRERMDGYCWLEDKIIDIPMNASPALFLHEVAHALYPEPEQIEGGGLHFHGSGWGSTFGKLVDKYMVVKE